MAGRVAALAHRTVGEFPILYATVKRPAGPCALTDIYGPNWAVRTAGIRRWDRFNERIGPDSTQKFYPMGSETEFFLGWRKKAISAGSPRKPSCATSFARSSWRRAGYSIAPIGTGAASG